MFPTITHTSGRKMALLLSAAVLSLVLLAVPALAAPENDHSGSDWQFSLHLDADNASLGAGRRLAGNWWLTGNLDHLGGGTSPRTSLSAVFEVPPSLFFFRFYGGGGIHNTASEQSRFHATIGARFWFLFWEYEYPLNPEEDTLFRNGIRLRF